jgi:hypothetical protein
MAPKLHDGNQWKTLDRYMYIGLPCVYGTEGKEANQPVRGAGSVAETSDAIGDHTCAGRCPDPGSD